MDATFDRIDDTTGDANANSGAVRLCGIFTEKIDLQRAFDTPGWRRCKETARTMVAVTLAEASTNE